MNECSNGRLVSFLIEGDDVVSCEVCLEPFQPLSRPPKILPCGHNFCDQCLFSLCCHQQYYLLDSIKCPTCRTSFPTNVAIEAPTNWDLCKILENVQKGRELNVTVIHVPDTPSRVLPENATPSTSKAKRTVTRTLSKSQKERCSDCDRKLSTRIIAKAARFCMECSSKERISFTCLECCVNKHNGHALFSLSQLEAEQLKVLGELRELRRRVFDSFSSPTRQSTDEVDSDETARKHIMEGQPPLREVLSGLDDAIQAVESTEPICPKKLSFDNTNSLSLLIPLLPRTPLSKELSLLIQELSPKQPLEQRCEAFLRAAQILTNILYDDVPIEQLSLFSDALQQCFCQANCLSRKKPHFSKSCSRRAMWKGVQLAYTELMRHAAKNFLSYEPERIAILGDLAYLCRIFADVCDQEIDDHLLECRRLQKLQDLRTTKSKRGTKLKWLWRFIFRQSKQSRV
ncbi:unnamed protein product [Nippostrongylus brasiliensis]|uniref:RING-type domain-containing protein n=1 Tax=Nippostrongylus brasiliensis TaxID=27835 RepID=A0A0N4YKZ3_NIPBR|nr:unnamed protein product [Nippostrongylus brasiliensis]